MVVYVPTTNHIAGHVFRSGCIPSCTHQLAVALYLLSGQDVPTHKHTDIHNLARMLTVLPKDSWCTQPLGSNGDTHHKTDSNLHSWHKIIGLQWASWGERTWLESVKQTHITNRQQSVKIIIWPIRFMAKIHQSEGSILVPRLQDF